MKAGEALRQARRCEHMAYRIEIRNKNNDADKVGSYKTLNEDAAKHISSKTDEGVQEEINLRDRLDANKEDLMNIMMVPILKKNDIRFHQKHDTMKVRAREESRKAREKAYSERSSGQWKVYKDMHSESGKPMIALRRTKRGKKWRT